MEYIMRTAFLTSTILASCLSTSAFAQGAPGFYAGGQIGYDTATGELDIPNYEPESPFDHDHDGLKGGVFAGYNFALSNGMVVGVEAGANLLGADGETPTLDGFDEEFQTDASWEASVVGRLGATYGGYFLYGLAGASMTELEGNYTGFEGTDDSRIGYTLGVGAERAFGTNLFGRMEVRYADYGTFDLQCDSCGPTNVDYSVLSVNVGVGMNF